jgi:MFS family permease
VTSQSPEPADAPAPHSDNARLLANRDFILLLAGQTVSNLGDIVFDITLTLWIAVNIAAGQTWAPMAVSGALLAASLPVLVAGPIAGVFVDRWNRRNTMLLMDAVRAILVALLLIADAGRLPARAQIAAIYAVVFLVSVCSQFFSPARVATIVDIVDEPLRAQAASTSQLLSSVALIVGPAAAAPLFFRLGVRWALILNALSFAFSWTAIFVVRPRKSPCGTNPATTSSLAGEFRDGLRFFAGNSVLRTMLIASVIVMLGGGAFNALGIFFLTENLHATPELFGIVSTTFGAGMLAGSILAAVVAPRWGLTRVFSSATVSVGALILVLARLRSFPPALVTLFLLGAVIPALQVTLGPLMLKVTPRDFIGRVVSVISPVTSAAEMLSMLLAGTLASTVLRNLHARAFGITFGPYDTILTVTGFLALAAGFYSMVTLKQPPSHPATGTQKI